MSKKEQKRSVRIYLTTNTVVNCPDVIDLRQSSDNSLRVYIDDNTLLTFNPDKWTYHEASYEVEPSGK